VSAPFVDAETSATRAVATTADVSDALASELLDAGAVYVDWWPEGRRAGGDDDDESAARWRRLRGDVVRRGARRPRSRACKSLKFIRSDADSPSSPPPSPTFSYYFV
jgi:hypothetical protein